MTIDVIQVIDHFAPTIGVVATGFFGFLAAKSNSAGKRQTEELLSKISDLDDKLVAVKQVGDDNNRKIDQANKKLTLHDESHLVTMYVRLRRDLNRCIRQGSVASEEFAIVAQMFENYKALGGNGYIERLYRQFLDLEIKEN